MESLPYPTIKRVREIVSDVSTDRDFGGRYEHPTKKVNRLLKEGWMLLAIHRRVYRPDDSVEEHHGTVYILGHTLPDDTL